jgi:hypothetical protein
MLDIIGGKGEYKYIKKNEDKNSALMTLVSEINKIRRKMKGLTLIKDKMGKTKKDEHGKPVQRDFNQDAPSGLTDNEKVIFEKKKIKYEELKKELKGKHKELKPKLAEIRKKMRQNEEKIRKVNS